MCAPKDHGNICVGVWEKACLEFGGVFVLLAHVCEFPPSTAAAEPQESCGVGIPAACPALHMHLHSALSFLH